MFVHTGDKKELHCEIEVASKLSGKDAKWFINGTAFRDGAIENVKLLSKKSVSMLIITDINYGNEGNYECRIGDDIKEANIVVLSGMSIG